MFISASPCKTAIMETHLMLKGRVLATVDYMTRLRLVISSDLNWSWQAQMMCGKIGGCLAIIHLLVAA